MDRLTGRQGLRKLTGTVCAFAAWMTLLWLGAGPDFASAAEPPNKVLRLGVVGTPPKFLGPPHGVIDELAKLGYVEGRNLVVTYRGSNGDAAGLPSAAKELAGLDVDIIMAIANSGAFAAKDATHTIPIVVWGTHGAVEIGLVSDLRHPGGNLTGTESLAPEVDAKRVELLKQLVPGLSQLSVLFDASDQGSPVHLSSTRNAGRALGISIGTVEVRREDEIEAALAQTRGRSMGALLIFTSPLTARGWPRIRDFALANKVPTVCEWRELAKVGCLLSYGPNITEYSQRTAAQIDKIFKGAAPGDLPIEQMTRFELVVNRATAASLGIMLPRELLMRANDIID